MKAMALPFSDLRNLPGDREAWVTGGPLSPRNAVIAGSWFLMREIELSTAAARSVTISMVNGKPTVRRCLPVSKTDWRALGVARSHGRSCAAGLDKACPAHVLWDQLLYLQRRFPKR